MAKKKDSDVIESTDTAPPIPPDVQPPAVETPAPIQAPDTTPAPEPVHDPEKLELRDRIAKLEQLVRDAAAAPAGITLDQRYEEWKLWASLPAEQKTQLAANKAFARIAGTQLYRVVLTEHPDITVPAHSPEEAVGRYNKICGIRQTDHQHAVSVIA